MSFVARFRSMRLPQAHEHLCRTVGSDENLRDALRIFLHGLEGRNGIFVHRYSDERAWELLDSAGPARDVHRAGRLTVVGRVPAFQGGGSQIDFSHVADVVEKASQTAEAQGRGLSILADASHAYLSEARAAEWFAFELWLGRRLARDVTLVCLYWERDLADESVRGRCREAHLYDWTELVPAS